MSNNKTKVKTIKFIKKTAKQLISDKNIRHLVKPKILPTLKNKLIQLTEHIEKTENENQQLKQQQLEEYEKKGKKIHNHSKTHLALQEIRNEAFCLFFFTQNNIDLMSRIAILLEQNENHIPMTNLADPKNHIHI